MNNTDLELLLKEKLYEACKDFIGKPITDEMKEEMYDRCVQNFEVFIDEYIPFLNIKKYNIDIKVKGNNMEINIFKIK